MSEHTCVPSLRVIYFGATLTMTLVLLLAIHSLQNRYLARHDLNFKMLLLTKTLSGHPELCKIVCKINTEKFNNLLHDHPNQPFVQSVIIGLTEGFWPWAEPQDGYLPLTMNLSTLRGTTCERDFLLSQRQKEIEAKRFSEPFDTLLPGMNIVPVHVVPKPPDDKLRLVVDHSAGPYSINSMIDVSP